MKKKNYDQNLYKWEHSDIVKSKHEKDWQDLIGLPFSKGMWKNRDLELRTYSYKRYDNYWLTQSSCELSTMLQKIIKAV